MSKMWRAKPEPAVLWRCWDGEFVAYCEASGDTHHLEGLAAEVFNLLLKQPASCESLYESIASGFNPGEAMRLGEAIPKVIENLAEAELIEPIRE